MTDQPSKAAMRKARDVLRYPYPDPGRAYADAVMRLARHFDDEDKAARDALGPIESLYTRLGGLEVFAERHILPDPKPTVDSVLDKWAMMPESNANDLVQMLRDAGLLREDG